MKKNRLIICLTLLLLIALFLTLNAFWEKPIESLSQLTAKDHHQIGYECFSRKEYIKAISHYKQAISLNSNIPKYHLWLGRSYLKNNQKMAAIKKFTDVLKLDPHNKNAKYLLSQLDIALYNILKTKTEQFNNSTYQYIYNLDVLNYYDITPQELGNAEEVEGFYKSTEYKKKLNKIKDMQKQMMEQMYYKKFPMARLVYNPHLKGTFIESDNIHDFSTPENSFTWRGNFDFLPLKDWGKNSLSKKFLVLNMSKKTVLEINENIENCSIYKLYKFKRPNSYISNKKYEFVGKELTIVIANDVNGDVYYYKEFLDLS